MGKALLDKLLPMISSMEWPTGPIATAQGLQTYEVGLEKVYSCKGDPQELMAALRVFQTGDSLPYAYAGIAFTLVAASQEKDGSHVRKGLDIAMEWLEKAQAKEPDIVAINVIEALIYTYSGRFQDARVVLDFLQRQEPTNYYLHLAEIAYWYSQKDLEHTVHWIEQAAISATTVPQRLRLRVRLGDVYLEFKKYDEALKVYEEAIHFSRQDPWLWHKASIVHWRRENFEEAERCNQRALKLRDFPEARKMESLLKKKKAGTGMLGWLLGRQ